MACGLVNFSEIARQQVIQILLVCEVFLTISALGIVGIAGYLKHLLSVSSYVSHVVNLAEGRDTDSRFASGIDYIISVGAGAVLLHFTSIKIWADMMHYKKRDQKKSMIMVYGYLRLGFVCMMISTPIVCKYQQDPLMAAFELAETEVGIRTTPMDIVFANYFTWYLTAVVMIEVSISAFDAQCYKMTFS